MLYIIRYIYREEQELYLIVFDLFYIFIEVKAELHISVLIIRSIHKLCIRLFISRINCVK
jgi:hypothetical protein